MSINEIHARKATHIAAVAREQVQNLLRDMKKHIVASNSDQLHENLLYHEVESIRDDIDFRIKNINQELQ